MGSRDTSRIETANVNMIPPSPSRVTNMQWDYLRSNSFLQLINQQVHIQETSFERCCRLLSFLGTLGTTAQSSRRVTDINRPWCWPWCKHKFLTLGNSISLQRQWRGLVISRTEEKILPVLLLVETEEEPASALKCDQQKRKWPQRPLWVAEAPWASYQKVGSAQCVEGIWVSPSGLRSSVIISMKQDDDTRGPQGPECPWHVYASEWPWGTCECFPPSESLLCLPPPLSDNTEHYHRGNISLNLLSTGY